MTRAAAVILALALASCDEPAATEIVLVVDTDRTAADRFVVTVSYPDGEGESSADLGAQPPPRTLVLVHRSGPLGPVRLRIAALEGVTELVAVEREVRFEADRSLTLRVFLGGACVGVDCPAGRTCGETGTCRDAAVRPCEYEGRSCEDTDAGADPADGGPLDAGGCGLAGAICGAPDTLLPGDRIVPVACEGGTATTVTVTGPSGPLPEDAGGFVVVEPGAHVLRLAAQPGCALERTVTVAGPTLVPHGGVAPGALRDLDARVGAAFVAGENGAWAVDRTGWVDLRADATGAVADEDLSAVAVHDGQPIFGPTNDVDAVFRVLVDDLAGPFAHQRVELAPADGDRSVRDMAVALFGGGTLAIATADGLVGVDFPPMDDPQAAGIGSYGADWITVGTERPSDRGEVWLGGTGEIVNHRLDRGPMFDDGQPNDAPAGLLELHAAALDDRDPAAPRLWLCGDGGVGLFRLEAHAWDVRETLPDPDARWTGSCVHVAVGPDGHAWIATGDNALVRLGPDAREVLRYANAQGLASSLRIDRVAVAWDDARREVWGLDATAGEAILFAADAF